METRHKQGLLIAVIAAMSVTVVRADPAVTNPEVPSGNYVTREEYNKLLDKVNSFEKQGTEQQKQATATQEEADKSADELDKRLKSDEDGIGFYRLGTSKLLISGYAFAGYQDMNHGKSTFGAGISPIVVWSLSDRLFVESELELGLGSDNSTDVNLEYVDINFIVNDYLTLRAGRFLTPFGQFPERLHPAWINKLPDFPLAFNEDQGLVPFSSLGFEARGAAPLGPAKINYAAYVSNGSSLITDDPNAAGSLDFTNYHDLNRNKAVGGRIAFLPIPDWEIGYSIQFSNVSPSGFENVDALLQGVDTSYIHQYASLKGTIDLRAEWVWSNLGAATYDPTGKLGFGPLNYRSNRNGGYVQCAYRPTLATNPILQNLEFVARYDSIHVPEQAPGVTSEQRATFGVNYWFGPSAVLKSAYEFDDPKHGDHHNTVLVQAAIGF